MHPQSPAVARLGPFWATSGRLGAETKKGPYLRLGAPNRESEGTLLGYHPPGLVVSTRRMGLSVRLAPRTGRRTPFLANLCPQTEKRPYLGLGAPNCESGGTCLGYHPPGLVVSTHQMGPNARLAPRTGRRTPFLANLGPQPGHQSGPKRKNGRISG